ncbi:hypothetical protein EYC08_11270 [Tabrizicola sp. WMC-M-20]|nr:hypothetical protein EYC08_11270 [Tabrizicola sp. WMC-M-20]
MSAPQTNIDKQKRRHRGPLLGMIVVVIAVGIGFVWWLGYEAAESDPVQGDQTQIDGRTGEQVPPGSAAEATDPTVVRREEQSSPGVPAQNVDPQTPADIPAVDPIEPETSTPSTY